MYISDKHQCVLISNVNTASRSICKFFADNYDFEEKTPKHSYRLEGVRKRFGDEYAEQVRTYSVIMTSRDPFERAVSIWSRLKEYKNQVDGYGIYWETFTEFAKYIEKFQSLPKYNPSNWINPMYDPRWSEKYNIFVLLPLSQEIVKNWAIQDFGKVDYILDFANVESIKNLPFTNTEIILSHIGASGVDFNEYDTEENRRLISLWDKGIK